MSDDPQVKVLPVPEGSIIWLHNIAGTGEGDDAYHIQDDMLEQLAQRVPHKQFVVLVTNGTGVVDVLGPDELVARVRAALEPTDER